MKIIKVAAFGFIMLGMFSNVNAQFTNYNTINSDIPSEYVCGGVAIDQDNNVWVGTDAGVAKFDGAVWTVFTTADGLPVNIISCIAVDLENNIWIGTDGDGVAKYDGSVWTSYKNVDGLCDNGIHYIVCDADTSLWFGSWGAGVSKYHDTTWTTYNNANGFPSFEGVIASVYYMTVDALNNKWFGTDLGLVKYNNIAFDTINQNNTPNLRSNFITAVAVDDANNKWLGVLSKGIAKLDASNTWVANYDTVNGLCNNGVTDVIIDADGNIWIGEYTIYGAYVVGGITKFNAANGTGISYDETDGLINEQVFRIAADQNNDIWIATGGGLSVLHDAIGVKENTAPGALNLYPNPAHDFLTVDCDVHSGLVQISDVTGRIITTQKVSSPVKMDVSGLIAGVYFIHVTEGEMNYNGVFIKE